MEGQKEYTLHYFGFFGRGEPVRMLLTHANIPFEDKRYTLEEWPGVKSSMPNG